MKTPRDVKGHATPTLPAPHVDYMRLALRLARRGRGATSPNPMVGALLVKRGRIIGRGWHHRAGEPHAEIEALCDAQRRRHNARGATLYVTLEPCCTAGRTPPCTEAIIAAGIRQVVAGATDPNPRHCGRGFALLRRAGLAVARGVLAEECEGLNEAFNYWITRGMPLVTVKAAMTLDGKIATASGESKWITGELARQHAMRMRQGTDAILVGIGTVLADDPSLTLRWAHHPQPAARGLQTDLCGHYSPVTGRRPPVTHRQPRRIVLDALARTPPGAKVVNDEQAALTTVVVSKFAPKKRVAALAKRVNVLVAPVAGVGRRGFARGAGGPPRVDLRWLVQELGAAGVTSLLVEGGGEVNASFLLAGLAQRIAFFYAPKILGGRDSRPAVAGDGARNLNQALSLSAVEWRRLGPDWLLTARVEPGAG